MILHYSKTKILYGIYENTVVFLACGIDSKYHVFLRFADIWIFSRFSGPTFSALLRLFPLF